MSFATAARRGWILSELLPQPSANTSCDAETAGEDQALEPQELLPGDGEDLRLAP